MEQISLQTMAQQLREKKAQVEASVAKLQMEANFNLSGFYNVLLQRLDILMASGGSISNPDTYFQQEITKVMNLYQIPLENEMNQAFNLQGIFPFALMNLSNTPPPASSSIVMENNLQVISQKLLQKKTQVEASLLQLQMEIRTNLIVFYEYLLQRVDILAVAGGSIPNPVVYLQEEIGKASTHYQKPLAIALTEAFSLQAVFSGENLEHGRQQASNQAGASSAAAPNQAENEANPGIVALLEEDEDDDIKSEINSDVEDQMPEAAEDSRNEPGGYHRGYSQAAAEQWYNLYRQSMPPGPVNPNRRPSAPVKEEIMDDNPLALVLYQPPAGHRADSGSIEEQEENYLGEDDESENEDAIVEEEEEFDGEESDHFEEQDVLMSEDEEDEEASFADDDGDDSNEDAIMDETDDDEDAENMSDIEEDHQNGNEEDNSSDDSSDGTIIDDTNYEEDGEEEEAQAALGVAGPSSWTLRRSTRNSARVTTSSGQEHQDSRRVSKRQTVAGRSSNGARNGHNVETEPLSVITLKLKCTVPGCKKVVKTKKAMNDHLLSAHKLKRYRCLVRRCYGKVSTSFSTQAQLSDHIDQVHGRKSRLICLCSKKFKSYKELNIHYWKYHQLGHFACSKDGCTFKPTSTRVKVMHHQANHLQAKYECPVDGCDRSFKQKGGLDAHTLTHTGERPFPCPECDKSFNQKGNLTTHLRMHRNDKCYRCTWPQCAHTSTNRSDVISHIRVIHFLLPRTKKQQAEENIMDDRDPRDFLAKN